jgi:hypothetical protein
MMNVKTMAAKLWAGLKAATCSRTWMPGACPAASGSMLTEKRREHD